MIEDVQGVCKDCQSATLNNRINPVFGLDGDEDDYIVCLKCGSTHVDVVVF